jgi:hypothetical protein
MNNPMAQIIDLVLDSDGEPSTASFTITMMGSVGNVNQPSWWGPLSGTLVDGVLSVSVPAARAYEVVWSGGPNGRESMSTRLMPLEWLHSSRRTHQLSRVGCTRL